MKDTKAKGDVSEACVVAALVKKGKVVLKPLGDRQRYDLVIDDNGRFIRVQVKTAKKYGETLVFRNRSIVRVRGKYEQRFYSGEVEFFGVYCPEVDACYLVPAEECARGGGTCLRLGPTKNKQRSNVKFASQFQI